MRPHPVMSAYREYYAGLGYTEVRRYPLVHPAFRTSFVLSAGVIDMLDAVTSEERVPVRRFLIQPCFRHFDATRERLATGRHLSLFTMGGALYFSRVPRADVVQPMVRFLTECLSIDPETLWLTTFAGGRVHQQDLPADEESAEAWIAMNLPLSRVVRMGAASNFWYEGAGSGDTRSGLCGPHAELFVDRGKKEGCEDPRCAPGCVCGRYLEVGNAVFPEFRLTDHGVQPLHRSVAEGAIGLDRVVMVVERAASVFQSSPMRPLMRAVARTLLGRRGDPDMCQVVVDHLRSFCCLVAEGAQPGRSGRGHVLRRLLRTSWVAAASASLPPSEALLTAAAALFEHPEATAGIDLAPRRAELLGILNQELSLLSPRATGLGSQ